MPILSCDSYEALLLEIPKYPGNYLEIGVYDGDMLKDFAERWRHKTFYGIDPFISDKDTTCHHGVPVGGRMESQRQSALDNFKGMSNIVFFEVTSQLFMETMNQETLDSMEVSIVYVDGNHSYNDTLNDLWLAARLITKGLIYIDDYNLPDVLRATENFMAVNRKRIESHNKHRIILK